MELLRRAYEQEPDSTGLRSTRWAVVRNTYRELIDTTLAIFFEWIPKEYGTWSKQDLKFVLHTEVQDGTHVRAEFLFRALDKPKDVKKLLSLNLTGVFVNECREVPLAVVEAAQGRCGRYPSVINGGPTWFGLIADTNPPDSDHWWYRLFEEDRPENHELFRQPSGLSPKAENIKYLPPAYYDNLKQGKNQEWVNVYVHGQYGFVSDGKRVFPEYNDEFHFSKDLAIRGVGRRSGGAADESSREVAAPAGVYNILQSDEVFVGIDFGLTPAAVIGVRNRLGQVLVLDELVTEDMGAKAFGKLLYAKLSRPPWAGRLMEVYGDPAGEQRAQTDEMTPFMILAQEKIAAVPTYTNDFTIRRESVADLLVRLCSNGRPALLLGPGCPQLRKAMSGGYKYRRMQVVGEQRFVDKPDKNKYSHVAEALQYLVLGAVGEANIIGSPQDGKKLDYSNTLRAIR
jgi:hypothetical protein